MTSAKHVAILAWLLLLLLPAPLRAEQGVALIDATDPAAGWRFGNGQEFPGARGSLTADPAMKRDGRPSLRLVADLSTGGKYVDMSRDVSAQKLDLESVSFWLKAPGLNRLTLRLIDGAKRCHQIALTLDPPSDDWRLVSFPVRRFFDKKGTAEAVQGVLKYESWGGDKQLGDDWVGDLRSIVLLAGRSGETSTMWVSGLVAGVRAGTISWDYGFEEETAALPSGWSVEGPVRVAAGEAFAGARSLALTRAADRREQPVSATGPIFPVAPGVWAVSAALRVALESPDASYCGSLHFQALDAAGKVVESTEIATPYGTAPWLVVRKEVRVPAQVTAGRMILRLNKTVGEMRVDALMAQPLSTPKAIPAVDRVVLTSTSLGNLFLPDAPRLWKASVETTRPLAEAEQRLEWTVRDYWGAEIATSATVRLTADGTVKGRSRHTAQIDLAGLSLETGRYYELHAVVPLTGEEPYRTSVGLAILPEAASRAFAPHLIPFTARNWDNRVDAYIRLSDRLGFRTIGIWGSASPDPPHKAQAPGIERCKELGAAVLTGCPARLNDIEYHRPGWERWTKEETIRGAVRSWFTAFGAHQPKPIIVNLGNEPHGTGEQVKQQVAAYKIAYDEIKKVAPDCFVVATSVPATEEYFQAGYQDACDAFDFHVYETPEGVRQQIMKYQTLMRKYRCEKPIWATELGLNSQGLTRQHIASDMVRKFSVFFAAGGASMNWFDLLYPDPEGKALGTSGDSFNMFDSRYNAYAARLDAVMCYHLINGILDKRCVGERDWGEGRHGTLFRDEAGACFLTLWKDGAREDVFVPLPGVQEVTVIRVDGRTSTLQARGAGLGLTLGQEPLLLRCTGLAGLPDALAAPTLRVTTAPARLQRGVPATIELAGSIDPGLLSLSAPAGWTVERSGLRFIVTSPEASQAREGGLLVRLVDASGAITSELGLRPALTGRLALEVRAAGSRPAIELLLANQSSQPQTVTWSLAIANERALVAGAYTAPAASSAYLGEVGNGTLTLEPNSQRTVAIPVVGTVAGRIYQVAATLTDATGGTLTAGSELRDLAATAP